MPSLGTLVTVLTADTSGFTAGMNTAAQQTEKFSNKVKTSSAESTQQMSRWGEEADNLGKRFTSLHGIIAIAFGVHLGRQLFTELHEGLGRFIEGMSAARGHGMSWADSLKSGLESLVGMTTELGRIAEIEAHNAELEKEAAESRGRVIGQGRSQFNLYREFAHSLGEEMPGFNALPESITDPKLRGMHETLTGRVAEDSDKIAKEKSDLLAIAARRKALEASYSGPNEKYYAELDKINEAERDAKQKILEATDDQKFSQALLAGLTKAAAERQQQLNQQAESKAINIDREQKKLLELMDKGALAPAEKLADRASIGGLEDLHNQLQAAALGGDELPKINAEQIKQTQQLQGLNDKLKNNQPLIWAGVA